MAASQPSLWSHFLFSLSLVDDVQRVVADRHLDPVDIRLQRLCNLVVPQALVPGINKSIGEVGR